MKDLYQIGIGPERLVSAELRPYHKGWMISQIIKPVDASNDENLDFEIIKEIILDADNEGVILYLGDLVWHRHGTNRYVYLGFQVYSGVPRRRPEYQGRVT